MIGFARRLIAAALAVLISASIAFAYSDEAVEEAEKLVELTKRQFDIGSASRTDLAEVEQYLLEMKYRAGKISRATYCFLGVPALSSYRDLVDSEYLTGLANLASRLNSRREFYKLKAFCEERKHSE